MTKLWNDIKENWKADAMFLTLGAIFGLIVKFAVEAL